MRRREHDAPRLLCPRDELHGPPLASRRRPIDGHRPEIHVFRDEPLTLFPAGAHGSFAVKRSAPPAGTDDAR